MSCSRQRDWNALKRVLRYLKGTQDVKLKIEPNTALKLSCYADADWAGDSGDRKSTTGFLFQLGTSSICWSSKKQPCVALSSTEAEYIAAAEASKELVWLRLLMQDLGLTPREPTIVYEDNQACIKLATTEGLNPHTKHVDVRYHYLRDLVHKNVVQFRYCDTKDMTAGCLTKPLSRGSFERFRTGMGLI